MRRTLMAGVMLAAMCGGAGAQQCATTEDGKEVFRPCAGGLVSAPRVEIHSDGQSRFDWSWVKTCAAEPSAFDTSTGAAITKGDGLALVAHENQRNMCLTALAARLDGWRAAGGKGEPPE